MPMAPSSLLRLRKIRHFNYFLVKLFFHLTYKGNFKFMKMSIQFSDNLLLKHCIINLSDILEFLLYFKYHLRKLYVCIYL